MTQLLRKKVNYMNKYFLVLIVGLILIMPKVVVNADDIPFTVDPVPLWSDVRYDVTINLNGYAGNVNTTQVNCAGMTINASTQQSISVTVGPYSAGSQTITCASADGGTDSRDLPFVIQQNTDTDIDGWFDNGPDDQRDRCPNEAGTNQGCPIGSVTDTPAPETGETPPTSTDTPNDQCLDEAGPPEFNGCWRDYRRQLPDLGRCELLSWLYIRINIRSTPEILDNNIVGSFDPMETPRVLESRENSDGEVWHRIDRGWVSSEAVEAVGPACPDPEHEDDEGHAELLQDVTDALTDGNCSELIDWIETQPDDVLFIIDNSSDPCIAAFDLQQRIAERGANNAVMRQGLLSYMLTNCPIQAGGLLNVLDEVDPEQANSILQSFEDTVGDDFQTGCDIALSPELVTIFLDACDIPTSRWERVTPALNRIGATQVDLEGDRGCELMDLLNLLGGGITEPQAQLYDLFRNTCAYDLLSSLRLVVSAVGFNNDLSELSEAILAHLAEQEYDPDSGDLPPCSATSFIVTNRVEISDSLIQNFESCDPVWVSLLINQITAEFLIIEQSTFDEIVSSVTEADLSQEARAILDMIRFHPTPCRAIIYYLRNGAFLPLPEIGQPTPPDTNHPPIVTTDDLNTQLQAQGVVRISGLIPETLAVMTVANPENAELARTIIRMAYPNLSYLIDPDERVDLISSPILDRDGERVAYLAHFANGEIALRWGNTSDASNFEPSEILRGDNIVAVRPAWTPNGEYIMVTLENSVTRLREIRLVSVSTGEIREEESSIVGESPYFSPNPYAEPLYFNFLYVISGGTIVRGSFDETALALGGQRPISNTVNANCETPVISNNLNAFFKCNDGTSDTLYVRFLGTNDTDPVVIHFDENVASVAINQIEHLTAGPSSNYLSFSVGDQIYVGVFIDGEIKTLEVIGRLGGITGREDTENDILIQEIHWAQSE